MEKEKLAGRVAFTAFTIRSITTDAVGHCIMNIHCFSTGEVFEVISFEVEVRKDYCGNPYFIVKADSLVEDKPLMRHIWLLETPDFNEAYDLKNRLDEMIGQPPSVYQKRHCRGNLHT